MRKLSVLLILLLFVSGITSVKADWTDDFSDNNLDGWEIWTEDYAFTPPSVVRGPLEEIDLNSYWEVSNEELVSAGSFDIQDPVKFNVACRAINLASGYLSFDYYWPRNPTNISLGTLSNYVIWILGSKQSDTRTSEWGYTITLANPQGFFSGDFLSLDAKNKESLPLNSTNWFFGNSIHERGWQHYQIERQERFNVYLDGDKILSLSSYYDILPQLDQFCISSVVGVYDKYDNFEFVETERENGFLSFSNPLVIGAIATGIVFTISGVYLTRSYRVNRRGSKYITSGIKSTISPILRGEPAIIFSLWGSTYYTDSDLEIPSKIFEFKDFFHPVKLAILKLLSDYPSLTLIELQKKMGLTWNEFNPHLYSLKEKGYLRLRNELIDNKFTKVVILESHTIKLFNDFKFVLKELLSDDEKFQRYLKKAVEYQSKFKGSKNGDLYPKVE